MIIIESKKFCVKIFKTNSIINFNETIGFWNELAHIFMPLQLGYINLMELNKQRIYSSGVFYISEEKYREKYYVVYIHDIDNYKKQFEEIPKNRILTVKGNFYGKIKIHIDEYLNKNHANNRE